MAKIKRWIPFGWLPGHWGLEGSTREKAKIEYNYDGDDRKVRLLQLEPQTKDNMKAILELNYKLGEINDHDYQISMIDIETVDDPKANQLAKLKLEYDQGKLTARQYDIKSTEIEFGAESDEYLLMVAKHDYRDGEYTDYEYEKRVANILHQPWVKVVSSSYEPEGGLDGFSFELDYNRYFVQYLKENGYTGLNDDEVVEEWFNDVSKSEYANEIEADFTLPKTTITRESVKTQGGKNVKKFY